MILNEEGQNYPVVKELLALLRGIMPKHNSKAFCLNCLYSFRTKNLKCIKGYAKKNICHVSMPSEDTINYYCTII